MSNPHRHPVEQPAFRSLMVSYLFLGVVLLVSAEQPGAVSGFPSVLTMLFFAIFVISSGLYRLAWILREHELWREGGQGEQE